MILVSLNALALMKKGIEHFYFHSETSREISSKILRRLSYSNKECEDILFLIKYNDY